MTHRTTPRPQLQVTSFANSVSAQGGGATRCLTTGLVTELSEGGRVQGGARQLHVERFVRGTVSAPAPLCVRDAACASLTEDAAADLTAFHAWMHACMDAWMHGCMHAWMHGCMDTWMHGCMDAWMHAWMDACMHTYIRACVYIHVQSTS